MASWIAVAALYLLGMVFAYLTVADGVEPFGKRSLLIVTFGWPLLALIVVGFAVAEFVRDSVVLAIIERFSPRRPSGE